MGLHDVKMEKPTGTVDGFNLIFTTALDYEPGTLRVWVDGILMTAGFDDGFIESAVKEFQLKAAPPVGTKLTVFYTVRFTPIIFPIKGYGFKYGAGKYGLG